MGDAGPVPEIPIDLVRRNFETHVFMPIILTQGFIRKWVAGKKKAKIVFTSGMGSLFTPGGFGNCGSGWPGGLSLSRKLPFLCIICDLHHIYDDIFLRSRQPSGVDCLAPPVGLDGWGLPGKGMRHLLQECGAP
ncbi:hypothetical protein EAH75_00760 [Rhodanobacter glycinis]|uniref:Uncharacterized protein n=2 Tax=Rhodanobacter glycinis TaxID=582702 RepID=A0A502FL05_9GAMM|nr:hypothetical protein EAH88_11105 [Rhodanobacter glycinis]TPG50069.1 hypothetical protein EAH75_00760 [Rhodanobacter glycinis]